MEKGKDKRLHKYSPYILQEPEIPSGPFVFSSPHSGRHYPERLIKASVLMRETLRKSEDAYVDQLFANIPSLGAPLLAAFYPRVYVDLNRGPSELDPSLFTSPLPHLSLDDSERVRAGFGLIPRVVALDLEIYDKPLDYKIERSRINEIYRPYHMKLYELIMRAKNTYGWAALIDCHSMPSIKPPANERLSGRARDASYLSAPSDPDIVLGDRFGRSCSSRLVVLLEKLFAEYGYSVTRNEPYAGGYCTQNYGDPTDGLHAIQIEINRRLYMNERTMQPRALAFEKLKSDLSKIMSKVTKLDLSYTQPLAAE